MKDQFAYLKLLKGLILVRLYPRYTLWGMQSIFKNCVAFAKKEIAFLFDIGILNHIVNLIEKKTRIKDCLSVFRNLQSLSLFSGNFEIHLLNSEKCNFFVLREKDFLIWHLQWCLKFYGRFFLLNKPGATKQYFLLRILNKIKNERYFK